MKEVLDENKAEDVRVFSLEDNVGIADYIVIASGQSSRQVMALSDYLYKALKKRDILARVEGKEAGDWLLVDAGDIVVHIFKPEVRDFYNLERIWEKVV
ncbi:MAG: ribosome silencing factor [Alphaproteobacteria bacterium]